MQEWQLSKNGINFSDLPFLNTLFKAHTLRLHWYRKKLNEHPARERTRERSLETQIVKERKRNQFLIKQNETLQAYNERLTTTNHDLAQEKTDLQKEVKALHASNAWLTQELKRYEIQQQIDNRVWHETDYAHAQELKRLKEELAGQKGYADIMKNQHAQLKNSLFWTRCACLGFGGLSGLFLGTVIGSNMSCYAKNVLTLASRIERL